VAEEKIEQYKAQLEKNFEKEKRDKFGDMEDQADIEEETNREITSIQEDYDENKDKVIDFLIDRVMNVDLEIPRVVKGDYSSTN
jgi:V-type H+-transporting ATPase subunit G